MTGGMFRKIDLIFIRFVSCKKQSVYMFEGSSQEWQEEVVREAEGREEREREGEGEGSPPRRG